MPINLRKKPLGYWRPNIQSQQSIGLVAWYAGSYAKSAVFYESIRGLHGSYLERTSDNVENLWVFDTIRNCYVYNINNSLNNIIQATAPRTTSLYTFSAWVYPTDDTGIVFSHELDSSFAWTVKIISGKLAVYINSDNTFTTLDVNNDEWSHVAVSYAGGNVYGYVNGVEEILYPGVEPDFIDTEGTFSIGGAVLDTVDVWNGYIDDVRVYKRFLSQSEIQQIYNFATRWELFQNYDPEAVEVSLFGGIPNVINDVGSGGILLNGDYYNTFNDITEGIALLAGNAETSFTKIPSGGAVVGGESIQPIMNFTASGGCICRPYSEMYGTTTILIASNGVVASGLTSSQKQTVWIFVPSGQAITSGQSKFGIKTAKYNGSGAISLNGSSTANLVFNKVFEFNWNVDVYVEKDVSFYWNTGKLQIYWYRIIGKGIPGDQCPPLQADPCCQRFVLNVHARTLSELCQRLQERRYKFPIESVQRFSRPAENAVVIAQEAEGINHDCNRLEEVGEICAIPECAEFCVRFDEKINVSFSIFVQVDSFYSYESSGETVISDSADYSYVKILKHLSYVAEGEIEVYGEPLYLSNSIISYGRIVAGGNVFIQCSRWTFIGGVYPEKTDYEFGNFAETQEYAPGDIAWQLPEKALVDDGTYTQTDISYGKKSELLIVRDFRLSFPDYASIIGIKVYIDRLATQSGIRDDKIYLIYGNEIISDNLADINNDFPLIETVKTYGGDGVTSESSWRLSDDWDSNFDINQLSSSLFGVAIRVKSTMALPSSLAKIDYIGIEVFYEDSQGSIIRVAGESLFKSPVYHYICQGKVKITGRFLYYPNYRFLSKGLGSSGKAEVFLIGSANITYNEGVSQGVYLGGDPHISPYEEISDGGCVCQPNADIKPYFEFGDGGAIVSGKARTNQRFVFLSSGEIEIVGDAFTPEKKFSYAASGSVVMGEISLIRSSIWKTIATGTVVISGGANQHPSDFGTLTTDMQFGMSILQISALFLEDTNIEEADGLLSTLKKCDCRNVPLKISMSHNMMRNNVLAQFLARNNISVSPELELNYNTINDSWQTNLHYRGLAADGNYQESWNIVCEVQCINVMGGIDLGMSIWKSSIQVIRRNLFNNADYETRFIVAVLPESICGTTENQLNYEIFYNTKLDYAILNPSSTTIYQNTLFDNIGLFRNSFWLNDPVLVVKVSQSSRIKYPSRLDLTNSVLLV